MSHQAAKLRAMKRTALHGLAAGSAAVCSRKSAGYQKQTATGMPAQSALDYFVRLSNRGVLLGLGMQCCKCLFTQA